MVWLPNNMSKLWSGFICCVTLISREVSVVPGGKFSVTSPLGEVRLPPPGPTTVDVATGVVSGVAVTVAVVDAVGVAVAVAVDVGV